MNKFSELGIQVESDRTIYDCKQISITDVVNCEVVILDYIKDIKTRHGLPSDEPAGNSLKDLVF